MIAQPPHCPACQNALKTCLEILEIVKDLQQELKWLLEDGTTVGSEDSDDQPDSPDSDGELPDAAAVPTKKPKGF